VYVPRWHLIFLSINHLSIYLSILSYPPEIDCWVSRRYTTHDATQFRDAWIPHTQTQRHGELAMMNTPL
jgi:hypothetical protein